MDQFACGVLAVVNSAVCPFKVVKVAALSIPRVIWQQLFAVVAGC
jgi:hypothetical protein